MLRPAHVAGRWQGRVALLLTLFAGGVRAADVAPLRICLLAHNAPYSIRAEDRGFDLDVARAVAARLARPLEIAWTDNNPHIDEIDDSDFPLHRLAKGACDAIFSIPGPAADTLRETPSLTVGANYYAAAFELLSCEAEPPRQLRALRGRKVAIQSQTVAHFATLMVKGKPNNYFSIDEALTALRAKETDAALLWGPTTGWRLVNDASPEARACGFVADYQPPAAVRWNLAVATRKQDAALRDAIDRALAALREAGEFKTIAARYGVPDHPPYDETYSMRALNELQQGR
ncbi:MAG: substrate-binding periplasmic protein [Gammaproteobacteria bacterium]